jgi:hypothetical protein
MSFPGTVPGYVCVLLRDSPCRKPGDSPQVYMRVLLWICLLKARGQSPGMYACFAMDLLAESPGTVPRYVCVFCYGFAC